MRTRERLMLSAVALERPVMAVLGTVYYGRSVAGEVAESAEGSRLLSGYRGKTSVQGSNPCLSANAPLAPLDRASDYESEGRGFDSLRAHHPIKASAGGDAPSPSAEAPVRSSSEASLGRRQSLTLRRVRCSIPPTGPDPTKGEDRRR